MANLKQIEKFLKSKKISYKVIDLGDEMFTVKGVAETGVSEDEIVKTLIVRTNDNFLALAVRGKDRINFKKVRKLFGSKSGLATADEVQRICKVPVGAVCPILLGIPVYFDKKVLQTFLRSSTLPAGLKKVMNLKRVNMGSGDLTRGLEMEFSDLLKAVREPQVEDLIKISTQIKL